MKPLTELEHEYVERRLSSCVAAFTGKLKGANARNRERLKRGLAYWTVALNCHQTGQSSKGADRMKKMYLKDLSKAVRDGRPVGETVERSDAYHRAVENRRRYEKARHTSFANQSEAVDASMNSKAWVQDETPGRQPDES